MVEPDAWFAADTLVFGATLGPQTFLSRGAEVRVPDLEPADQEAQEASTAGLRAFLEGLDPSEALQWHWTVDADYAAELQAYEEATRRLQPGPWARYVRTERAARYRHLMANGELRRERLTVWLGRRASFLPRAGLRTPEQRLAFLGGQAAGLAERLRQLEAHLPGAEVRPMDDAGHFAAWRRFLNPSRHFPGEAARADFDPDLSALWQTAASDAITSRGPDGAIVFKYDDRYHAILVVRRWPRQTHWGVLRPLTRSVSRGIALTLVCRPRALEREIRREEIELTRLHHDAEREHRRSLGAIAQRKGAKIDALSSGFLRPFSALLVIRVWDASPEALSAKVLAVKGALSSMHGAQAHQVDHPVQARRLFFETFPGWMGGTYRAWDLYVDTGNLPDLTPLSASFSGHALAGEALYENADGGLAGVRTFSGDTPQHAVCVGMTRAGKSAFMIDLLSQTDPWFARTVIVEEGLSYGTLVRLLGGETLVLRPDGDITFNYFDPLGLPLTREQQSAAVGLLLVMAGGGSDPERLAGRRALLAEYVDLAYRDVFEDELRRDPALEENAARLARAAEQFRRQRARRASDDLGFVDAFAELARLRDSDPTAHHELLAAATPEEILAFAREPATRPLVRDAAFALLPSARMPTHSVLVELLRFARLDHHDRNEVDRLASLLSPWTRHGPHGRLFDGVANRRLDSRVVHIELGGLPRSEREVKEAAVFALGCHLRQSIVALPRRWRKRFIFEEPSRYLDVPGAADLFSEFYAQLGKYGCVVVPVTQQYRQMARHPELRSVVFGNAKQFFLLKQQDRQDLDEIGDAVGLSSAARQTVRSYLLPEHQTGPRRHASIALHAIDGETGTLRHHATPEMLYVANSSGEVFDERERALAAHADPLAGVLAEVARRERSTPQPPLSSPCSPDSASS